MRVRQKATLVPVALALVGLIASFGCQGEKAREGRTSGSPSITIQASNGVLDGSPSSETTTGKPTALSGNEECWVPNCFSPSSCCLYTKCVEIEILGSTEPGV
jgi:hypothetical protein